MAEPIKNRYDFVFYFDVKNGNPNGDPDAGNMPRIDPETSRGIVSDVCLKRKVRNYVDLVKGEAVDDPDVAEGELGYKIYVQEAAVLNDRNRKAYVHYDMKPASKKLPKAKEDQLKVTKFMCDNFFDIRAFGAVMTTDVNCGLVRGPIQLCFAESVDPVLPLEMSISWQRNFPWRHLSLTFMTRTPTGVPLSSLTVGGRSKFLSKIFPAFSPTFPAAIHA